ncbi:hypothetical protein LIER_40880 [Lithospermum erythrorhizon]|uniref:TF-B3 domain-containing protein n=1 Tax=Lithospermum erythrorhizon TaxID=34254 RepID=A0AAV3R2G7_LITER
MVPDDPRVVGTWKYEYYRFFCCSWQVEEGVFVLPFEGRSIPSKFVKEHWDELSESVRLFIPTGRSWCVGVERDTDKSIWLQDGLLKFMEDNSVGIEQKLNGGVEKKGADDDSTPQRRDMGIQSYERIHKTSDAYKDDQKTYKRPTGKNSSKYKDSKGCAKKRADQAENVSFPTSFEVTMKTYNIEKYILHVPKQFARLNMPHSTSSIKLLHGDDNEWVAHQTTIDADNNEWVVCYICESLTHALTQGWIDFMGDKNLTVGDTCTFERVCGVDEIKLKVTISKFVK